MTQVKYVYLAGPITGLYYDEATSWRGPGLELPEPWVGLSPMRGKDWLDNGEALPDTFDGGGTAVQRDLSDIRRASAVIVNLLAAQRVSIGSMAELGYAYARAKPICVVMEPEQAPQYPGNRSWRNPHDHVFVQEMATTILPSLDEAIEWLSSTVLRSGSAVSEAMVHSV